MQGFPLRRLAVNKSIEVQAAARDSATAGPCILSLVLSFSRVLSKYSNDATRSIEGLNDSSLVDSL